MKTCFSEEKLIKQFGNPTPFLREPSPLSTNSSIPEQFFHDRPLCPNFKNKYPPQKKLYIYIYIYIYEQEETMHCLTCSLLI